MTPYDCYMAKAAADGHDPAADAVGFLAGRRRGNASILVAGPGAALDAWLFPQVARGLSRGTEHIMRAFYGIPGGGPTGSI